MTNPIHSIFDFLRDIAVHNNREWFEANRPRYEEANALFAHEVEQLIKLIARFEPDLAGLPVKSCLYRFHRDTRFSPDKSPYKRHLGAYMNARGKKSLHGGYYFHLEPGHCMIAGGSYCLPPPVLRAVRMSIVAHPEAFRNIVEEPRFRQLFPEIGEDRVKTLPKGFDRSFPYPQYLRPKDYSVCHKVDDRFFDLPDWREQAAEMFLTMKPFLDWVNETVDDYI